MLDYYIGLSVLAFWLVCGLLCFRSDRRAWNKGCCPYCDKKWRPFDLDSSGARGYACDFCMVNIWISWPIGDDNK